ncbi:SRPBCC family protein [Intrasporangium sp. YIM S08009]|uniref:SRPBCC family protein n=1 Tax=Intrasporangium zincisolvens TaxID=3080018 RepID=UPI002B054BFC|nr:SRPBCC family protein [Intrasporangium sp. YIM S08009]
MARFEMTLVSSLPAPEAWRRILNLRAHSEVIPLTTVTGAALDTSELTPGARFVARTGLGPIGFDDVMVIESYTPPTEHDPGVAHIRKEGRTVTGRITLRVAPTDDGCVVMWKQRIGVRRVPGFADVAVARVARSAYRRTLLELLRRS